MATAPTKPIHRISAGPIAVAIWQHDGKDGLFYTASVQKWYRKDNKDEYTSSFGRGDLLEASKLLELAHTWIIRLEQQAREKKG